MLQQLKVGEPEREACRRLARLAVREDLDDGVDITSQAIVPADMVGELHVVARAGGIACGLVFVAEIVGAFDCELDYELLACDGQVTREDDTLAVLRGAVRTLLTVERTLLNFLGRLSGVASTTRQFVDAVAGTRARIFDTRKTTPGWRVLEKYAVRAGGGQNHRMGLYDAVLVKDNHRVAWNSSASGGLADLVRTIRRRVGEGVFVEVEVDTLEELEQVIREPLNAVLLDNFSLDDLRRAVELRDRVAPSVELEASGGISLETVRDVAETGVERISTGALTHRACWLDLSAELRGCQFVR